MSPAVPLVIRAPDVGGSSVNPESELYYNEEANRIMFNNVFLHTTILLQAWNTNNTGNCYYWNMRCTKWDIPVIMESPHISRHYVNILTIARETELISMVGKT